MRVKEYGQRYLLFLAGMACTALGVALMTKAALGNSPVSAIPCSLSYIVPALTLGNWSSLQNLSFVLAEVLILRRNTPWMDTGVQVLISMGFGFAVDAAMFCLLWLVPVAYPIRLLALLTGCVFIAAGTWLQLLANVAMLPGDAFVRMIAQLAHTDYGRIKTIVDACLTAIAALLSLAFLHRLVGVREGTLIAVLSIGTLIRLIEGWMKDTRLCLHFQSLSKNDPEL